LLLVNVLWSMVRTPLAITAPPAPPDSPAGSLSVPARPSPAELLSNFAFSIATSPPLSTPPPSAWPGSVPRLGACPFLMITLRTVSFPGFAPESGVTTWMIRCGVSASQFISMTAGGCPSGVKIFSGLVRTMSRSP